MIHQMISHGKTTSHQVERGSKPPTPRRLRVLRGQVRGSAAWTLTLVILGAAAWQAAAATHAGPTVGAWATYRWTSSVTQEVPVLVQEAGPGGRVTWSVTPEPGLPRPLFVTYAIVRGDPRTYTLQIVTHQTLEAPPLSITQVQIDRASGKAVRSVIQRPKGLIETPESGLRPLRQGAVKGTQDTVTVPGGRFPAIRAPYRDGTVWVSDEVPPLGLVKATSPTGTLELIRSGTSGGKDLLRS